MQCEHARDHLFDYLDDHLPDDVRRQVSSHLDGCDACQADYSSAFALARYETVWHDQTPPRWQPPRIERTPFAWPSFFQWFPTLASTAALAFVALLYFDTAGNQGYELQQPLPTQPVSFPDEARESLLVQNVLESSRSQRQKELEALVKLLKAEMDRRSLETEESLRYVIAHQVQEQQELDELRRKVQKTLDVPAEDREAL